MTYKDLIDALVRDSGDAGSGYRENAFRWLNFSRQEAAARGTWKSAKNSGATLTTSGSNLTGVYELTGFDCVTSDEMYDETNDCVIRRDTEHTLRAFDANLNQFGFPTLWADSGMTVLGEVQVRFWPIPNAAFTIGFLGSRALTDITSANEAVSIDPFFGALSTVGAMLQSGLRYYHDMNNNEDAAQVGTSKSRFYAAIKTYSGNSGADSVSSSRLEPVGRRPYARPTGRLDPSHFNNR